MFLNDILDVAKTAKAWVAGFVAILTQIVAAVQLAAADEAISLTEAKGVWLLVTEAVGMVAAVYTVWRTKNRS